MAEPILLSCACGHVVLRLRGRHIISTECLCNSCRAAGKAIERLVEGPSLLDERGATRYVLYRKDRVDCIAGAETLREHRLAPDSQSRRVVATCCNTPMFLDFTQGHWLSLYGGLWPPEQRPALDLRTMVADMADGTLLPNDVPNARSHTLGFFARLIAAWAAMGFRTPKITYVNGELDVR